MDAGHARDFRIDCGLFKALALSDLQSLNLVSAPVPERNRDSLFYKIMKSTAAILPREADVVYATIMIWALLIGLILGSVASLLMPKHDPGSTFVILALGIGGSTFAAWLGMTLDLCLPDEAGGYVVAILGAFLFLSAYRALLVRTSAP